MKRPILFVLLCLVFLSCESDTSAPTPLHGLHIEGKPSVSMVGGGRWFEEADTGTYYDAYLGFNLNNATDTLHTVHYELQFGILEGGVFITDSSRLRSIYGQRFLSDTFSLAPNTTIAIFDTFFVDLCQTQKNDWFPYFYQLRIRSLTTEEEFTSSELVQGGGTPENRFHGVIRTHNFSTDSIGLIDGPDDGDYREPAESVIDLQPSFPNPTNNILDVIYWLKENCKILVRINLTPLRSTESYTFDNHSAGPNTYHFRADNLLNGQYRVYVTATPHGDGKPSHTSYGDFIFVNP